jgi:quercetin dioxygenase-like cupin family protein
MLVEDTRNVKCTEVAEPDIVGVSMKVLLGSDQGAPNFVMREFAIEKDGHTAYHTHEWEHEVYVLEGKGAIKQGDREIPVERGSFALIKPDEEHQFINKGRKTFRFICVVPAVK